ncbi:MAG: DoxX family protein [Fluviicola sp.]
MNRGLKFTHWLTTGLVCLLFTASALTYIFQHEEVCETFELVLGFPAWLVYPMALAKLCAVFMLISKFSKTLTEWAYAGLVYNSILAIGVHIDSGDTQIFAPLIGLVLILASYFSWKRKLKLAKNN